MSTTTTDDNRHAPGPTRTSASVMRGDAAPVPVGLFGKTRPSSRAPSGTPNGGYGSTISDGPHGHQPVRPTTLSSADRA